MEVCRLVLMSLSVSSLPWMLLVFIFPLFYFFLIFLYVGSNVGERKISSIFDWILDTSSPQPDVNKLRNHIGSLNIQSGFPCRQICIPNPPRPPPLSRHVIQVRHASVATRKNSREFGPSVVLANMMSLGPKIDELRCFANDNNPDLISLTETCIYDDTAAQHHLHLPGYNLCLKNRKSGWVFTLITPLSTRPWLTYTILSWRCCGLILGRCDYREASLALFQVQFTTRCILTDPVMLLWWTILILRLLL